MTSTNEKWLRPQSAARQFQISGDLLRAWADQTNPLIDWRQLSPQVVEYEASSIRRQLETCTVRTDHPTNDQSEHWVTPSKASELYNISRDQLYAWRRQNLIAWRKPSKQLLQYEIHSIERRLEACTVRAQHPQRISA